MAEKLTAFQKMARHFRKEALAYEVFDKPKEAKEKRKDAKLMDRLHEFDKEFHKNRNKKH
tara:strand:- start:291 stop:470 length:180 start_codon:yes stop_codon:yes gene_type:complete